MNDFEQSVSDLQALKAKLETDLKQAIALIEQLRVALFETEEFKQVAKTTVIIDSLNTQIKLAGELIQQNQENALKKTYDLAEVIKNSGYEVRCDHTFTASSDSSDVLLTETLDPRDSWVYVIVRNFRPKIDAILLHNTDIFVFTEDGSYFNLDWFLAHGQTEEQAWEMAAARWQDWEDKETSLSI